MRGWVGAGVRGEFQVFQMVKGQMERMERMERIFDTRRVRARVDGVRGRGTVSHVCVGFIVSIPSILSFLRLTL